MSDVLVTGATGAIGLATAQALSEAGFTVHLAGRDAAKLEAAARTIKNARALPATDLDDPRAAQRLVEAFAAEAKAPHGLVANAANLGTPGAFADLDFERWQRSFNTNFFSHAAMIQRFIRLHGKHVVVMSGAGLGGSKKFVNVSSYSTAKAALTHLVEALAGEYPDMSFNAVAPGAVVSNMTEQALAVPGHYGEEAKQQKANGGVPATLAARMIVWLMQQQAPFVSGRLLAARFDFDMLGQELNADRFRMRRIDGTLFK